MRATYRYASDDRVVITRPQHLREMDAIRALRVADGLERDLASISDLDVRRMVEGGWRRSNEQFRAYKKEVWRRNEDTARRILQQDD